MSEHETEPQEPAAEPEPVEPDTAQPDDDPDQTEGAEPDQEPAGPQEPAQEPAEGDEAAAQMRSEKELEKGRKQIDKLRETNANRLAAIMGDEATFLIPCPVCGDEFPGFVFPPDVAPVDPEKVGAVSAYIGLPDLSVLEDAPDAIPCPDCRARGEVKTGSLVPGQTTKMCSRCVGKGWIGSGNVVRPEVGIGNGQQVEQPAYAPPVETGLPPELEAYKDRYLIVKKPDPIVAPS